MGWIKLRVIKVSYVDPSSLVKQSLISLLWMINSWQVSYINSLPWKSPGICRLDRCTNLKKDHILGQSIYGKKSMSSDSSFPLEKKNYSSSSRDPIFIWATLPVFLTNKWSFAYRFPLYSLSTFFCWLICSIFYLQG